MSNWDFLDLDNSNLDFDNVQNILIKTYNYFLKNCAANNIGTSITEIVCKQKENSLIKLGLI